MIASRTEHEIPAKRSLGYHGSTKVMSGDSTWLP
jgi:hypothetical protein